MRRLLIGLSVVGALETAGCSRLDRGEAGSPIGGDESLEAVQAVAAVVPPMDEETTTLDPLHEAEQRRLRARDDALLEASAEAQRREEEALRQIEERELRERVARVRRKRAETRRRFLDWHPIYRRELAAVLAARSRLSSVLKTRSLEGAEATCQNLLARARSVDREALLAAPDRRVNEDLKEILDGYQRGAAACAERSAVVAWTLLTAADERWAEVHQRIDSWVR